MPPLHGEMRCKHQQPLRLSASAQSLHIYGSWREGVPAVRGGLSGADRLLRFARKPPNPEPRPASSVRANRLAFLLVSRWGRQDGAKHLLPSFDYCPPYAAKRQPENCRFDKGSFGRRDGQIILVPHGLTAAGNLQGEGESCFVF